MTRFEPEYTRYSQRIRPIIINTILALVFVTVGGLIVGPDKLGPYVFIIAGIVLMIQCILVARKRRFQVTAIAINEQTIEVLTVNKDVPQAPQQFPIDKTRIKITELFFGSRTSRNFKLQIDTERNGRYQTVIEQHETRSWNLELFKEIYLKYCETKNIPASVSAFKKTNL